MTGFRLPANRSGEENRFRRRPTGGNSRRIQTRLLVLVGMFAITVFLMRALRDPEKWRWMWGAQAPHGARGLQDNVEQAGPQAETLPHRDRPAHPRQAAGDDAAAARLELQAGSDQPALAAVEDDTVFRGVEAEAWFRLFEILNRTGESELNEKSAGRVSYLQLYRQPRQYRGKLVTVGGAARLAYHVQAPKNPYGIEGYYVFWIRPFDGANRPIAVYSLALPSGFPSVKDRRRDGAATSLEEDVEFTGFFFKRWAYQAADGIETAPLILAKSPHWRPRVAEADTGPETMNAAAMGLAFFFGAALAIAVAVGVYLQSRRSAKRLIPPNAASRRSSATLIWLADVEVSPDAVESLRRLSEPQRPPASERGGGDDSGEPS